MEYEKVALERHFQSCRHAWHTMGFTTFLVCTRLGNEVYKVIKFMRCVFVGVVPRYCAEVRNQYKQTQISSITVADDKVHFQIIARGYNRIDVD